MWYRNGLAHLVVDMAGIKHPVLCPLILLHLLAPSTSDTLDFSCQVPGKPVFTVLRHRGWGCMDELAAAAEAMAMAIDANAVEDVGQRGSCATV